MKRTAEQKKVEAEKAALRQCLEDIARVAHGHHKPYDPAFFADEEYTMGSEFGLEEFAQFLRGVKATWPPERDYDIHDMVTRLRNYGKWDQPWSKVIDWAYEQGLRA